MFCWRFNFFPLRCLRAPPADRREILHDDGNCVRLNNPSPNFFGGEGPSHKKFYGPKTCKIWPDFGRLQSVAANSSGKNEDF